MEAPKSLRDAFWAEPPTLPDGVRLLRREPIVVSRPGPGGADIYDLAELTTPRTRTALLMAFQSRLLAKDVERLRTRLSGIQAERRRRDEFAHSGMGLVPAVVTDVLKPSARDACRLAGVAAIDQRGSVFIDCGTTFIWIEGKGIVERPWRGRLFSGKASRLVRYLLTEAAFDKTAQPRTAQLLANTCELSYVYAHAVLRKLEHDNYVARLTSHSGFLLRNPLGLLKAWMNSGERTAVAVEGFYAPATTRAALHAGAKRIRDNTGNAVVFSLASALEPHEVHVTGLPHAAYWTGEASTIIEAFGLRRTTPHNFLLLRPDPIVWTSAGGLLMVDPNRPDPHASEGFRRVAFPQLVADFAMLPGRGREQADYLLSSYAHSLPYRSEVFLE